MPEPTLFERLKQIEPKSGLTQTRTQGFTGRTGVITPRSDAQLKDEAGVLNRFQSLDLPEPEGQGGGGFLGFVGDVFDVVDTPRALLASTVQEGIDFFQGEGFSWNDWQEQFWDNHTVGEILQNEGIADGALGAIAGFAGDVALDPLTYVGVGAARRGMQSLLTTSAKAAKQAPTQALKDSMESITQKLATKGARHLSSQEQVALGLVDSMIKNGDTAFTRFGLSSQDEFVDLATRASRGQLEGRELRNFVSNLDFTYKPGTRLTIPGTGRVLGKAFGVQNKSVQILPNKFTPWAMYQSGRARAGATISSRKIRQVVGGDSIALKEMIASGEHTTDAILALEAARTGNFAKRQIGGQLVALTNDFERRVSRRLEPDQMELLIPAAKGNVAARQALPDDVLADIEDFSRKWADEVNRGTQEFTLTGGRDTIGWVEDWAPHAVTEDVTEALRLLRGKGKSPKELARLARTQSLDSSLFEQTSKKVGDMFMGKELLSPDQAGGMSVWDQMDAIFNEYLLDAGFEEIDSIFQNDFFAVARANARFVSKAAGARRTEVELIRQGVATDIFDYIGTATANERRRLGHARHMRERFRRVYEDADEVRAEFADEAAALRGREIDEFESVTGLSISDHVKASYISRDQRTSVLRHMTQVRGAVRGEFLTDMNQRLRIARQNYDMVEGRFDRLSRELDDLLEEEANLYKLRDEGRQVTQELADTRSKLTALHQEEILLREAMLASADTLDDRMAFLAESTARLPPQGHRLEREPH